MDGEQIENQEEIRQETANEVASEAAPATTEQAPEQAQAETLQVDPNALSAKVESLEKALRDTQSWGHKNAEELARLRRERDEEIRAFNKPELLRSVDGLEDAIKYVSQPNAKSHEETWLESVEKAIPDIHKLFEVPEFGRVAQERFNQITDARTDPIVAIRELSNLRTEYIRHLTINAEREAVKKEYEAKQKKLSAMSVPGGSGSAAPTKKETDWASMSSAEFEKHRRKILGY